MIIVTGTKRSGTSMWMQILRAAGVTVIGEEFPGGWEKTIRDANPEGFYESRFRRGINFRTNPDPKTGEYFHHTETRQVAVKVFVPGLIRSDMAFITKVLGSMRPWREYHHSVARLYGMERANQEKVMETPRPERVYLTGALEWWDDNFSLIRDALTRRYPLHMTSYESVLDDPERVIGEVIGWLGVGEAEDAVLAVRAQLKTQHQASLPEVPEIDAEAAGLFDELYARVAAGAPLDLAFIDALNALHLRLEPVIAEERKRVRESEMKLRREQIRRAREARERSQPDEPDDAAAQ